MTNKLVIDGGESVRSKEFKSRPYITDQMKSMVLNLMEEKRFSKFIGSPTPGTIDNLGLTSKSAENLKEIVTFLGGPSVRKFEALWSEKHNCDFSIAVNSATSALTTALMACNVGPGSEVICPPFSFTASATSIVAANAVPVFADIDLDTFCLSPESAESSITESTQAIMSVHWNSNAGEFANLMSLAKKHSLRVVEDAAQVPTTLYNGSYLGTIGDVGIFSFNEPKNIMTGEGGVIVTNDKSVAKKCRLIRNHGEAIVDETFSDEMAENIVGYNFRLVELLAELGVGQIQELEYLNNIRRENYLYLVDSLVSNFGEYLIPQKITHLDSYYPYTAGFRWLNEKAGLHRNIVARVLRSEGIPTSTGLPRLMSDHPLFQRQIAYGREGCPFSCHLYKRRGQYKIPELPNAKRLQEQEYLGFFQIGWPNTKEDIDDIIKGFQKIFSNKKRLELEEVYLTKNFISGR